MHLFCNVLNPHFSMICYLTWNVTLEEKWSAMGPPPSNFPEILSHPSPKSVIMEYQPFCLADPGSSMRWGGKQLTGKWDVCKGQGWVLPGLVDVLTPWLPGGRKEVNTELHGHSTFLRKAQANKKSSLLLPIFVF